MENRAPLLKDIFDQAMIRRIASDIGKVHTAFDQSSFIHAIVPALEPLSLTERAWLITDQMAAHLPESYPEAIAILIESFGPVNANRELTGLSSFYYMPHSNFVAKYGLDHFDVSMDAMNQITRRFTSEFSIRAYINKYPERTLAVLHEWAEDENEHVRRLVSEGTRTRLPWAPRLPQFQEDPSPVLALLEKLKEDPELYVRRSVANNLNDIGKDYPDMVVEVLEEWNKNDNPGTKWIIGHALRSLVKAGHTGALSLLGYRPDVKVEVESFEVQAEVCMGEKMEFTFSLRSTEKKPVKLMVDYVVHFMKANGKTAPKVFKLAKKELKAGETMIFTKGQSFKPISTRKYYTGEHAIELQVNGKSLGRKEFVLLGG